MSYEERKERENHRIEEREGERERVRERDIECVGERARRARDRKIEPQR